MRLARRRLWAESLLSLLTSTGYYGAYAYVIYRTVTGDLTWGTLQFLTGAIAGARTNIQTIFSTFSSIADQSLFLTDLVEFFGVEPSIRSKPDALPAPRPIRDGFRFEKVSFAYPGSPGLILDRLDLGIAPGERIALIGENGQGKTTIVKLLTRLYDPIEGRILLDGIDLKEYNIEPAIRCRGWTVPRRFHTPGSQADTDRRGPLLGGASPEPDAAVTRARPTGRNTPSPGGSGVEPDHQREVLAQAAEDHAADVRAEVDVGLRAVAERRRRRSRRRRRPARTPPGTRPPPAPRPAGRGTRHRHRPR